MTYGEPGTDPGAATSTWRVSANAVRPARHLSRDDAGGPPYGVTMARFALMEGVQCYESMGGGRGVREIARPMGSVPFSLYP